MTNAWARMKGRAGPNCFNDILIAVQQHVLIAFLPLGVLSNARRAQDGVGLVFCLR